MANKKLILFIVEGATDRISLEEIIDTLISDYEVRFHVIHGDITANCGNNPQNILKKINDQINKFLGLHGFKKSDVKEIVHLVDTDGCFINSESIEEARVEEINYEDNKMIVVNKDLIMERNTRKSANLNKMAHCSDINQIPYQVYYMSCNLEHVLHNVQNLNDGKKRAFAEKFSDQYYQCAKDFITFMSNSNFSVKGDYLATWDYIEKSSHSLARNSNLHLFFKLLKLDKYS
ncbi:MAG: hypothetical protein ACK5G7_00855 [Erysipelotrichaceae bacterium]